MQNDHRNVPINQYLLSNQPSMGIENCLARRDYGSTAVKPRFMYVPFERAVFNSYLKQLLTFAFLTPLQCTSCLHTTVNTVDNIVIWIFDW